MKLGDVNRLCFEFTTLEIVVFVVCFLNRDCFHSFIFRCSLLVIVAAGEEETTNYTIFHSNK